MCVSGSCWQWIGMRYRLARGLTLTIPAAAGLRLVYSHHPEEHDQQRQRHTTRHGGRSTDDCRPPPPAAPFTRTAPASKVNWERASGSGVRAAPVAVRPPRQTTGTARRERSGGQTQTQHTWAEKLKFRTDKFDKWNKRKFWIMKLM